MSPRGVFLAKYSDFFPVFLFRDISNVRQRDVADLDIVVPLVEQLDVADLLDNILGEDVGHDRVFDLDFTAVRHLG